MLFFFIVNVCGWKCIVGVEGVVFVKILIFNKIIIKYLNKINMYYFFFMFVCFFIIIFMVLKNIIC